MLGENGFAPCPQHTRGWWDSAVLVPLLHPQSHGSIAVLASDFLILSWSWSGWMFTNTFPF